MSHQSYTFYIEQLANEAWIVGWREGGDDYGRIPADRAGFVTYEEAEKFAVQKLRELLRKKRDEKKNKERLAKALCQRQSHIT